jgi:hypothetical protein
MAKAPAVHLLRPLIQDPQRLEFIQHPQEHQYYGEREPSESAQEGLVQGVLVGLRGGLPGFPARQQPTHVHLPHLGDGEQGGGIWDLPFQVATELLRLDPDFPSKGLLLATSALPLNQEGEALAKTL